MPTSPDGAHGLPQTMAHLCGVLSSHAFPTGERAALRRMSPGRPPPLYFYRFALHHLPDGWAQAEDDWITLVAGIALMAPHACRPGRGLGQVLGEQGYSEARLERLLQSEGETRRTLFLRAVRFLAAKAAPFDWADAARLLLTRDPRKLEGIHRHLAGDFYRIVDQQKQSA